MEQIIYYKNIYSVILKLVRLFYDIFPNDIKLDKFEND